MAIESPIAVASGARAWWLGGYRKAWLSQDVMAGLTSAAVVIPKAMAYATVAGCRRKWVCIPRSCRW